MKKTLRFITIVVACTVSACGGSSSDSGMVFEGTLTQGEAATHTEMAQRHSAGQNIENVEICALGECSTTDGAGAWGFGAPEEFTGGAVEFTIKGHGIDTKKSVVIPEGTEEVFVHFERQGENTVIVHHLALDGVRQ